MRRGADSLGLPFWWALVLTPLLMAVVGYAHRACLLIQRVFHSKDRHTLTLLLTFGIAMVLEDLLKIVFGANPLRVEQPITGATEMFGLFFPNYRLFLMAVGALVIGRCGSWSSAPGWARWCAPPPSTATWPRRWACR
jgi:branched-chain amino acid transport system permease protein